MLSLLKNILVDLSLANVVHSFVTVCFIGVLQIVVFVSFVELVFLVLLSHVDRAVVGFD